MSSVAGQPPHPGGRVLSNFGWLMMDRAGRTLISVVASIAVARHLGPGDFGVLSFAIALTGIITVCAGLGLDEIMVRDLGRESSAGVWRSAWRLRLGAAMAGYLVTLAVVRLWRPDAPVVWATTAIVAAGLFFSPCDLVDFWFQARQRMRPPALARQIALWCGAGWRLVLVALNAPLAAFAWANVAEAAAVGAALFWIFRREKWAPAGSTTGSHAGRLLHEGWPLAVSGLLVTLTMQADRLLLARQGGDAAVGVYAAAARLTEVMHALPLALGVALMPRLVQLYHDERPAYRRLIRRTVLGMFAAALLFSLVTTMLAPRFIPLVFGPGYAESGRILGIHIWTLGFVCLVSLRTRFLVIEAQTRWIFFISLLTAAFNISANLVLIPRYGGRGAAWAAVGAWGFSALIAPWFFPVTRKLTLDILRTNART